MNHSKRNAARTPRRGFIAVAVTAGLVVSGAAALGSLPAGAANDPLPYLNQSLPFSVRAADLVSRMTQEEKVQQFNSTLPNFDFMGPPAPAIERLGVRRYTYWQEALHGVARQGTATMMPTGLGIASTWDRQLVRDMNVAVSNEARAKYNDDCLIGAAADDLTQYCRGLTYWSPTINLARDPRWGRADENYGEDPYLAGEIAGQFVLGLQGGHTSNPDSVGGTATSYLKAVSTPKHYVAQNSEINRHTGTSNVTDRSLHEYYTFAFGKATGKEYGAKSMMPGYNAINVDPDYTTLYGKPTIVTPTSEDEYRGVEVETTIGTPVPANEYVIDTLLRRIWGFDGFVTSDCGATNDVYETEFAGHNWKPAENGGNQVSGPLGTAWSVKAGTDVDCWANAYRTQLPGAQEAGYITEADWDVALTRAFTIRMQLGEFDDNAKVPWANTDYVSTNATYGVNAPTHLARAHEMSLNSPTLLKNNGALPLTDKTGTTVILGRYATEPVKGGYSPDTAANMISAAEGLELVVGNGDGDYTNDPNLVVKDEAILNQIGAKPTGGDSQPLGAANAAVGAPISFWAYADVSGWNQTPGFFGPSFSPDTSLEGGFTIPVDISGGVAKLRVPFSGSNTFPTVVAGCGGAGTLCENTAGFNVTVGGTTVYYPLWTTEAIDPWTSMLAKSYQPLVIDFAADFPAATGQQDVRLDFALASGSATGINLTECAQADCNGTGDNATDEYLIKNAANVIVYVGTNESDSNEEADRGTTKMPRYQAELAAKVAGWNPETVVWIQSVAQVELTLFKDIANAIVWTTYNGEYQGHAVGEILFNEAVNVGDKTVQANPSGHLPFMYYSDVDNQLTKSTDYALTVAEGAKCGRTYWYYTVGQVAACTAPDYPFGHGLSYTTFTYTDLALASTSATPNDTVNATIKVTNTGSIRGRAVAQLYASAPVADGNNRPLRQLKGFAKTAELAPGADETLTIPLKVSELWFWDEAGQKQVFDTGAWTIQVGPAAGQGPTATLNVTGTRKAGVDVVTAIPDGVQLNVTTPHSAVHANLSATRHDQSFWDLSDPAVKVTYSSSDPDVAAVDAKGTVLPVSEGAVLITAKVEADGETGTTTFPIVVRNGLATDGDTTFQFLVDFPDRALTTAEAAAGAQLSAQVVPAPAGAHYNYEYLIAPMDLNEIGATITPAGVLTASQPGTVRVTVVATNNLSKIARSAYVTVAASRPAAGEPGDASKVAPLLAAAGVLTQPAAYTAETWKAFQKALADAKALVKNPFAPQTQIDAVAAALSQAMAGLKPVSPGVSSDDAKKQADTAAATAAKAALTAVVADADTLVSTQAAKYTPTSIQALQTALAAAKAAAANASATPAEVQAALAAVSKAVAGLVPAPAPVVQSVKAGTVKVTGTAKVGKKLTAKVAGWTKGTAYTYKWYAGSKAIKGATGKTLKLTKALKGKKIKVKVTGTKKGFVSAAKNSKATKKIK